MTIAPRQITGICTTRWTQIGGEKRSSTQAAMPTTTIPSRKTTKTAGPSPASSAVRSRPQAGHASRTVKRPVKIGPSPQRGQRHHKAARASETGAKAMTPIARLLAERQRAPHAPPVDADEQEKPDHIDEMPVPRRRLEAEMVGRGEIAAIGAPQADRQEGRADDHVKTVEPGRHKEGRRVDAAAEGERRMRIFVGLHAGEAEAEQHGDDQALHQPLLV